MPNNDRNTYEILYIYKDAIFQTYPENNMGEKLIGQEYVKLTVQWSL